jgi:hypothetical protein
MQCNHFQEFVMIRKTSIAAAIAALATFAGVQAHAAPAAIAVDAANPSIRIAAPAPVAEAVPAPRAGFAWIPGTHVWANGGFHWVAGHWIPNVAGQELQESLYVRTADGSLQIAGGQWVPDRYVDLGKDRRDDTGRFARGNMDRDTVANHMDSDYDGDGVLNWDDKHPLNASRG